MPNLRFIKSSYLITSVFVAFIFLIDRISKILIIKKSKEIGSSEIFNSKLINFELIWNKGIAFGLFSLEEGFSYQIISFLIILIIIILIYLINRSKSYEKFGFIMVLGGALGNLFDRLFYKAVPDFIELHVNSFHWFIFNIADIFITIGVICLILVEIFYKKEV
tara:strand:+ start:2406 stop:2897 length:492 start_codon:yes stop_codon:yes gene_type:complete